MRAWHEDLFTYKQLQIDDSLEENMLKYLDTGLDFLFNTSGNTLVHCGAGVSRSGSIVVAYLMKKYNLSYDDAIAKAREKSPRIRPNSSFERQLREWQKTFLSS
jgi:protein-tyrosine phosphatase